MFDNIQKITKSQAMKVDLDSLMFTFKLYLFHDFQEYHYQITQNESKHRS